MARLVSKSTELVKLGINHAKPVLQVWLQYAKVELTPPTLKDVSAIRSGFSQLIHSARTGRYRDVTVREGIINTLVAIEIYCWFFVGECIGKRHIVGYDV
ncbi:PREDICTED: ATP synthase subunit g, mitochondrial [Acromyrmex echinatior]|uniref:ATP synthase subunit g, mitochondrial n=1 Tax=Acromyrmex echinatior TaxID=103372 RepID=UPI0005810A39|nr:PREDICTED: ATP synthase subunit g, mitochondrial [Acromyrmex echinatior]